MSLKATTLSLVTVLFLRASGWALAQDEPQSPSAQNPQAAVVSLEELVSEALENNPEILGAQRKFEASTKRPSQLGTLPEPVFSLANFGVGHPFSALNQSEFAYQAFGVSQEVPFPGKLSLRKQVAQKEAASEGQMVRDVERRVVSRLKQGYYDLYFTHKAIETLQKNRDLLDRFAKISEARYRVGTGLQQDVLKSQVEISLLAQRLEVLEQQKASQEALLLSMLNRPGSSELGRPAELKKSDLTYGLDQLNGLARENAPRLRSRQEMVDGNAFALNLARKEYLPDFTATFQYQKTGSLFPDYYMAMAEVKVPLYFWRKQRLGVEEAASRLAQSRHEYQATAQELSFEIKDQYLTAKTAERLMALYEQGIIPQSQASLESALAGYEVGKVDFLTLINNWMLLLNFKTEYYKEFSNQKKALARLEELTGVALP